MNKVSEESVSFVDGRNCPSLTGEDGVVVGGLFMIASLKRHVAAWMREGECLKPRTNGEGRERD